MSDDVRKMKDLYHTDVEHCEKGFLLKFYGATRKKRRIQFHVEVPWDILPYITGPIQKKWADERARRVLKLNEIDRALPKPE